MRTVENGMCLILEPNEIQTYFKDNPLRAEIQDLVNGQLLNHSKVDLYEDCVLGQFVDEDEDMEETGRLPFCLLKEQLILFDLHVGKVPLEERVKPLSDCKVERNVNALFFAILESTVNEDVRQLQLIEEACFEMEENMNEEEDPQERIAEYRKQLIFKNFQYQQIEDMCDSLQDDPYEFFTEKEEHRFESFGNKAYRLGEHTRMLRDYLAQLRDLHQNVQDQKSQKQMQFLTILTTVFFPLTLITGWYGMNFTGMPELTWKYGYPVVLIVAVAVVLLELFLLKRKKFW